jgi:hypothetical protein
MGDEVVGLCLVSPHYRYGGLNLPDETVEPVWKTRLTSR